MFIWTLGDIVGFVIVGGIAAYLLYFYASGASASRWAEESKKAKPTQKAAAKDAQYGWLGIILTAIAFFGVIYLLSKI